MKKTIISLALLIGLFYPDIAKASLIVPSQNKEEAFSFSLFPVETKLKIFEHLDIKGFTNMGRTSKEHYDIIQEKRNNSKEKMIIPNQNERELRRFRTFIPTKQAPIFNALQEELTEIKESIGSLISTIHHKQKGGSGFPLLDNYNYLCGDLLYDYREEKEKKRVEELRAHNREKPENEETISKIPPTLNET